MFPKGSPPVFLPQIYADYFLLFFNSFYSLTPLTPLPSLASLTPLPQNLHLRSIPNWRGRPCCANPLFIVSK